MFHLPIVLETFFLWLIRFDQRFGFYTSGCKNSVLEIFASSRNYSTGASRPFVISFDWLFSHTLRIFKTLQLINGDNKRNYDPQLQSLRQCRSSKQTWMVRSQTCRFFKKDSRTRGSHFSCGFCEIFKNTFSTEQIWTTASDRGHKITRQKQQRDTISFIIGSIHL